MSEQKENLTFITKVREKLLNWKHKRSYKTLNLPEQNPKLIIDIVKARNNKHNSKEQKMMGFLVTPYRDMIFPNRRSIKNLEYDHNHF